MQRLLYKLIAPAMVVAMGVQMLGCSARSGHAIQSVKVPRHTATIPEERDGAPWWVKQNRILNERARQGGVELAFVGDSITEAWEKPGAEVMQQTFGKYRTCILGIGGDKTQHILWRVQNGHFKTLRPRLVVLLAGTNNLRDSAEQVADGVTRIIQEINKRSPQSRILVLGIFPRGNDDEDKLRIKNKQVNWHLKRLADNALIHYMDIGPVFLKPDTTIPREVMPDFLHLSPRGYQLWADAIVHKVDSLMQAPELVIE